MLSLLKPFQVKAYAILSKWSERAFFLHKCQRSDSLWVSDLPRHMEEPALTSALHSLEENGFFCEIDRSTHLLKIDLSLAAYKALLAPLPHIPPTLPPQDTLHPAYALCRLLFLHPSPLATQPSFPLRAMLKAIDAATPDFCLRLIPSLHRQCAAWLREGLPLPHAVGSVLCAWLEEQDTIFYMEEAHDFTVLRS